MPITKEQREKFANSTRDIKTAIAQLNAQVKALSKENETKEEYEAPYIKIEQSKLNLDIIEKYLAINDLSADIMKIKNESSLDEARKKIYEIFSSLEKMTSNVVDLEFSEIVKWQKSFPMFKDEERLDFIQRLLYLIDKVAKAYGDNSKWAISFIEIRGRAANIAKNLLDFIALRSKNDPREEGYAARRKLRDLVADKILESAKSYREKYEVSGHIRDDMKKAIDFLKALGRLYILENKREEIDKIKKFIALWKLKMEKDAQKEKSK